MIAGISYFQAIVMGILQGATELFPVSSLGHGVLVPGWLGWHNLVNSQAHSESFFLAFIVGLHVGTAVALIVFYWKTWVELVQSLRPQGALVRQRGVRMVWALNDPATDARYRTLFLLVIATIPVGIIGLLFEHKLRVLFVKPLAAAIFLTINGVIMTLGELLRRRRARHAAAVTVANLSPRAALAIGTCGGSFACFCSSTASAADERPSSSSMSVTSSCHV